MGSFNWSNNDQKIDQYTVLLGRFNGSANSKVFADKDMSIYNKGMTGNGAAHISTTQSKFGGSTLYLTGNNGAANLIGTREVLVLNDHTDWFLGTASFTIDWWHYSSSTSGQMIFGQYENSTNWWGVYSNPPSSDGNQCFGVGALTGGAWDVNISATNSGHPINTWTHYAVVRSHNGPTAGVAGDWFLFINGVAKTKTLNVGAYSGQIKNYSGPAYIGTLLGNFNTDCAGYISELRVSKGIARWTSNFTPPTRPYGEGENGVKS